MDTLLASDYIDDVMQFLAILSILKRENEFWW